LFSVDGGGCAASKMHVQKMKDEKRGDCKEPEKRLGELGKKKTPCCLVQAIIAKRRPRPRGGGGKSYRGGVSEGGSESREKESANPLPSGPQIHSSQKGGRDWQMKQGLTKGKGKSNQDRLSLKKSLAFMNA